MRMAVRERGGRWEKTAERYAGGTAHAASREELSAVADATICDQERNHRRAMSSARQLPPSSARLNRTNTPTGARAGDHVSLGVADLDRDLDILLGGRVGRDER